MRQSVSLYGGPIRGQARTRKEVQMNPPPPRICHRLKNLPWFQVLSKGDGLVLFTFYENFFQSTYFQVVSKLLIFAVPGFHICSHFLSCRGEGLLHKVQKEETITITLRYVKYILF